MGLRLVTITGADDSTPVDWIDEMSDKYPFIEWGILVSRKQMGSYRFPSRDWCDKLVEIPRGGRFSMHVCGAWVRWLLSGELNWEDLPSVKEIAERVQINTHAELHEINSTGFVGKIEELEGQGLEWIFQSDGVNGEISHMVHGLGFKTSLLFDKSGGAGILPKEWPVPKKPFWCGYAGGLGPDNVIEQIRKIEKITDDRPYWIDMERRVRTDDDSKLDRIKVEKVLKLCSDYIEVLF